MSQLEEFVHLGCINTIELSLLVDEAVITHTSITRCQIKIGIVLIDSDILPDAFDFTHPEKLILKFGDVGLTEGEYQSKLYVFEVNTEGRIFWCDLKITVIDDGF